MTSLNLQINLQIRTSPVGDFPIIWDEIGLCEPIEMEKYLEIFERNSFFSQFALFFFLNEFCFKKTVFF